MVLLRSVLLTATAAAVLFAFVGVHAAEAVRIDGGDEFGWTTRQWYVQVDGVMGGKSSGQMEFLSNDSVMKFTGDIVLDGGGFSSVRRQINLDLSEYAGVVVTLEADARGLGRDASPPTGLHLQFDDRTSRYDFSSAFAVPLSNNGDGTVVTSVYLPVESFDRASSFGFVCRGTCTFDPSEISRMSVYVLFQEGNFDVRLRSIEAVMEPRSFDPPAYDNLQSVADVVTLIRSTISSGGGLYDKGYVELCITMYWSVLNTILSSSSTVVTDSVRAVICSGLQQVEAQMEGGDGKQNIAWTLRYVMDASIADLEGTSRTSFQNWLPTPSEAASMEVTCIGRTSVAPGILYDPTNTEEIIVVSPTKPPTVNPTEFPTKNPTVNPTEFPTKNPTEAPIELPTEASIDIANIDETEPQSEMDNVETESPGENEEEAQQEDNDSLIETEDGQGQSLTDMEDVREPSTQTEDEQEELLNGSINDKPFDDSEIVLGSSTSLLDRDPIENLTTTMSSMAYGVSSSGSSSVSNPGFKSVVVGILILGVSQLL
mmetsp:Transcript_22469/g.53403  ORF Transcript_22469/g.53403 Transcript_22469/m.53403 type:complete len:542 (+) Transcript_22469:237-1862(+)